MRKPNQLMLVISLLYLALSSVSAQESTFDDAALIELKKSSAEKLKDRNLRIVTTEEQFQNDGKSSVSSEKSVNELLPPDRSRFVSEKRTASGIERTEYINIGAKRFSKYNNEDWKENSGSGNGIGSGSGIGYGSGSVEPKIESTVSKILKKGERVNNQTADLYQIVSTKKIIYPEKTYTEITTEAFWFDSGGKLLKTLYEFHESGMKTLSRTVQEYEYDPKLKIEAPIVKYKQNPK